MRLESVGSKIIFDNWSTSWHNCKEIIRSQLLVLDQCIYEYHCICMKSYNSTVIIKSL